MLHTMLQVWAVFDVPARLPSDTNKACHDVNTSSILAGGNISLPAAKATQNPLTGMACPTPAVCEVI